MMGLMLQRKRNNKWNKYIYVWTLQAIMLQSTIGWCPWHGMTLCDDAYLLLGSITRSEAMNSAIPHDRSGGDKSKYSCIDMYVWWGSPLNNEQAYFQFDNIRNGISWFFRRTAHSHFSVATSESNWNEWIGSTAGYLQRLVIPIKEFPAKFRFVDHPARERSQALLKHGQMLDLVVLNVKKPTK